MKMNRKTVILATLVALLLLAGVYLWGPSQAPATQKPLLTFTAANFNEFEAAFDETNDGQRLVLLLSPT